MRAMAPNPDDRYLSADDMLADLEEFRKNPNINFDYSSSEFNPEGELDDDRTQIRPVHPPVVRQESERRRQEERRRSRRYEEERGSRRYGEERRRRSRYEDEEDDYPHRNPVWPVFLAAAAVLLFVGLIVYFLWNTLFAGMLAPPKTKSVPKLVGEIYDEVKDNTELLNGFILIEGDRVANDADPGTIIDQDPKGEREVGESVTEIKVTISAGPDTVTMIDLRDKDYQTASTILKEMGLRLAIPDYENHDTIEQGYIISYTPLEGVEVPPGTEVHVVVSKGPADKPIKMPSLVNMDKELAEITISQHNLDGTGKREYYYDPEVPEGKVISQYPLAESEVTEGTVVNLVISKGPDPATLPPEPPPPENLNPIPVTRSFTVPLDGYEGDVNVRVLMDGAQVWNQNYDANMDSAAEVHVQGSQGMGVKEVTIFINGVARGTEMVNFDE